MTRDAQGVYSVDPDAGAVLVQLAQRFAQRPFDGPDRRDAPTT